MPNRIIKESIRESYEIDSLTPHAERTFYRLITFADDYGRFPSDARVLKSHLYPLKDELSTDTVTKWINEIVKAGLICLYLGDDKKPYGVFTKWEKHQQIRNKKSKYPDPEGEFFHTLEDQSKSIDINRDQLNGNVPVIQSNPIQSNHESNTNAREEKNPVYLDPPSLKEIKNHGELRGITPNECEIFELEMKGRDWLRTDKNGNKDPITNWRTELERYHKRGWLKPQSNGHGNGKQGQNAADQYVEATRKTLEYAQKHQT